MSYRDDLKAIYHSAIQAVDGRHSVAAALREYDTTSPVYVVAIGKAACSMYQGACDVLTSNIAQALVITKEGYLNSELAKPGVALLESGHPWPTQASLNAGKKLLTFIASIPKDSRVLFLISGGASSLVEVLPKDVSLSQLHDVNDWLLGSGLDIHSMNQVRKAISRIKGGRLIPYLDGRETSVLLISDVPGDDPATIGSGLLVVDEQYDAESFSSLLDGLPHWIVELIERAKINTQAPNHTFDNINIGVIANLAEAKHCAAEYARSLGYKVYEHAAHIAGDAAVVGRQLAIELMHGSIGIHIWGGETTVCLPDKPGYGGRNQHLALAAAIEMRGYCDIALLAAGTDGTDGPTEEAGALVDGFTVSRAGMDAEAFLQACDSGRFLQASGDLVRTGPTGTNVMDLMIGFKG